MRAYFVVKIGKQNAAKAGLARFTTRAQATQYATEAMRYGLAARVMGPFRESTRLTAR